MEFTEFRERIEELVKDILNKNLVDDETPTDKLIKWDNELRRLYDKI